MDASPSKPRTGRSTKPAPVISDGENRPNGSQAIRRRVAQLLQGHAPIAISTSESSSGSTLDSPEDWHPLTLQPRPTSTISPSHRATLPPHQYHHSRTVSDVAVTSSSASFLPSKGVNAAAPAARVDPPSTSRQSRHLGKPRQVPQSSEPAPSTSCPKRPPTVDDQDRAISVEVDRLKQEVELLKGALQEARRVARREAKKLLEAKAELSSTQITVMEKEKELLESKMKCRSNEELLTTIESSIQCQICMELPDKPFSLAPCGHILCLSCLQEWFRRAPPSVDDVDIDPEELTDPAFVLMRKKTCPTCRTVVKHRPAPAFMVKSVVTSLQKAKPTSSSSQEPMEPSTSPDTDSHPWKGIFPSSDEEPEAEEGYSSGDSLGSDVSTDGRFLRPHFFRIGTRTILAPRPYLPSDDDDEEEPEEDGGDHFGDDSDGEFHDMESDHEPGQGIGSRVVGSGEEDAYVQPRWAPARLASSSLYAAQYPEGGLSELRQSTRRLLARGCTREMLARYHVSYLHARGIIVSLLSLDELFPSRYDDEDRFWVSLDQLEPTNRLYLGWNITLSPGDRDGSRFLGEVLRDIKEAPYRWLLRPGRPPHGVDATRLSRREDEGQIYETPESDFYEDTDDFYLDDSD